LRSSNCTKGYTGIKWAVSPPVNHRLYGSDPDHILYSPVTINDKAKLSALPVRCRGWVVWRRLEDSFAKSIREKLVGGEIWDKYN